MVSFTFFLPIVVKLNANRMVVGTLRGFDQFMNLVVDNTVEVNGDDKTDIGMVVRFPLSLLQNPHESHKSSSSSSLLTTCLVLIIFHDSWLQVIRGNSIVTVEALEPVGRS